MGDAADAKGWLAAGFVGVGFRSGIGLFPLVFSLNTVFVTPSRPAWQVAVLTLVLVVPVAVEFTLSDRNVGALEQFVVGVVLFWLVATAARAGAGLFGAPAATADKVGLVLVAEGYLVSYLMIYGGWGKRLRESLG